MLLASFSGLTGATTSLATGAGSLVTGAWGFSAVTMMPGEAGGITGIVDVMGVADATGISEAVAWGAEARGAVNPAAALESVVDTIGTATEAVGSGGWIWTAVRFAEEKPYQRA